MFDGALAVSELHAESATAVTQTHQVKRASYIW